MPIGFLDSGVGGLSVMREAIKIMPNENYIYFGDSKNAPYGTKPTKEIRDLTFKVVEFLLDKGIKGLVVACNTATSAAVSELRKTYPDLPLVGIEPAIKPAVEMNNGGIHHYYENNAGNFANETVEALTAIGATHTALILDKGNGLFKEGVVPEDRESRIEELGSLDYSEVTWLFDELDNQFYEYNDDISALNLKYVLINKEAFM